MPPFLSVCGEIRHTMIVGLGPLSTIHGRRGSPRQVYCQPPAQEVGLGDYSHLPDRKWPDSNSGVEEGRGTPNVEFEKVVSEYAVTKR
jgi:hypothetical protein